MLDYEMDHARVLRSSIKRITGSGYEIAHRYHHSKTDNTAGMLTVLWSDIVLYPCIRYQFFQSL